MFETRKILFISLVFMQLCCKGQTQKFNGVSFVASGIKIDETHTKPVVKVQSNSVALMPFGFIKKLESPEIIHNTKRQWFGETKAGLKQYAEEFRKHNIQIMVKPQIWVWNGQYTGLIEMKSEQNWKKLEDSYTSFILIYAEVAQEIKAEVFCIGTELEKFVKFRPDYWQKIIKEIRKVYKGKLTYAANWDEFKRVSFWNELDFIGIDAYFPLTEKESPTVADFEIGWKPHKTQIMRIQSKYKKPIIFTEFGYRSVNYTGKEPWQSNRIQGDVNLQAQSNGLQAIYNQFWKEDWFAGGFIWKWFHSHNEVGGKNNNRFTPQNKPAEKLLSELYKRK
jgi:hypothetical protein